MSFSLADLKRDARQAMHDTLSITAAYMDDSLAAPLAVQVRVHNRIVREMDMPGNGMTEMLSSIDRIIFDREALADDEVALRRGGIITVPEWETTFELDIRDAYDGPVEEIWTVVRR